MSKYSFELKTYELGFSKKIPTSVLYRFLQEAAEKNAVELGFDTETLLHKGLTWVLLRLEMRCNAYPEGRQILRVETWPSGVESRYAFREFRIYLADSSEPFAIASSTWLLIDIQRQRPVQVAPLFSREVLQETGRLLTDPFVAVQRTGELLLRKVFPVRLADIDINGHVNNLHYVEWLAESVPEEIWRSRSITGMQVEYKCQARYGDTVCVETWENEDGYSHTMTSAASGTELFKAVTRWG